MDINYDHLINYNKYPCSKSCFLDGRYFNLVLRPLYKGIITSPLIIKIKQHDCELHAKIKCKIDLTQLKGDCLKIVRVIIHAEQIRHSALLFFNPSTRECWFWNPVMNETHSVIDLIIIQKIKEYLCLDKHMLNIKKTVINESIDENCDESGYCNAYIIMYVLCWLRDIELCLDNVKKFMYCIEKYYCRDLIGSPDIEYRYGRRGYGGYGRRGYGGTGLGLGLGLLGGIALGSALAAPAYGYPAYGYPAYGYPAYI